MNENQVFELFRKSMSEKFSYGYESFLEQQGIPNRLAPADVLGRVIDEQVDLGFDEFYNETKADLDENNVNDKISEYIEENYDTDYVFMQFESRVDEESIVLQLKEDLILRLINTEPYGYVSRNYWAKQVHQVNDLKELNRYSEEGDLIEFVDNYAPDWEEVAKENEE